MNEGVGRERGGHPGTAGSPGPDLLPGVARPQAEDALGGSAGGRAPRVGSGGGLGGPAPSIQYNVGNRTFELSPSEVLTINVGDDGAATFQWADELDLESWLQEYTLDEVWRLGRMGGRP